MGPNTASLGTTTSPSSNSRDGAATPAPVLVAAGNTSARPLTRTTPEVQPVSKTVMSDPKTVLQRMGPSPGILATMLVLLAAVLIMAGPPSARASNCPDLIFIGAAGSGELDHSASVVREYDSMGPEAYWVSLGLENNLGMVGITERTAPIVYPADSTNELNPTAAQLVGLAGGPVAQTLALNSWRQGNLGGFLRSLGNGISQTISVV